jgi:hypothetical protein
VHLALSVSAATAATAATLALASRSTIRAALGLVRVAFVSVVLLVVSAECELCAAILAT